MKLILTQEVTGLGAPGDVVDVKDGYARNFLFPRGLGTPWTKGGEKQVEAIRRARASREIATLEQAQQVKARLEGRPVTLTARKELTR
jgi:large subunit ribosomal protein L9